MARRLGFILTAITVALLATEARALVVCDKATPIAIATTSDTECLRVSGGARYESVLDSTNKLPCKPKPANCGDVDLQIGDKLMFSNTRLNLDPGFIQSLPSPVGLLEAGSPLRIPAYFTDVKYSGFKLGFGVDTTLTYDDFVPLDLGVKVEFGQFTGRGSSGSQSFTNLGVPSVGLISGVTLGSGTVSSTDITYDRTFGGLDKQLKVPLVVGEVEMWGMDERFVGYGIVGTRIGAIGETQRTSIATGNGTVLYDSRLSGGYFGAYLGLGMDKSIDLPDSDLMLGGNLSLTGGFDMHRYRVTDSVGGTALVGNASTNTYDVYDTVPTLRLGGGLSIGQKNWSAGINAAVSAGYYPSLNLIRPISNQPATPTLDIGSMVGAELSGSFYYHY